MMGDSRRPTPSHRLNAYCTAIVRVSYGYGYTRGSGRVWVEIFGAGRVRVQVASSATGTGRVAEMVDPHTPTLYLIHLSVVITLFSVRTRWCDGFEFYRHCPSDPTVPLSLSHCLCEVPIFPAPIQSSTHVRMMAIVVSDYSCDELHPLRSSVTSVFFKGPK